MIHLVNNANRSLYGPQIAAMHALRKAHFVDERGWAGMTVRAGGEYDAFDDDRAIYFLALDDEGQVAASMRARPTDDRCIVTEVFPKVIHPHTPSCNVAACWEISRICSSRPFRHGAGLRRRDEVFLAGMEAAADAGVTRLVGVVEIDLLPGVLRFPWSLKLLGLAAAYPQGEMVGIDIPVSCALLENARESLAVVGSIIMGGEARRAPMSEVEIHELLKAQHLPPKALKDFAELVSSTAAVQDKLSEPQLLALIDRLAAQWSGGSMTH